MEEIQEAGVKGDCSVVMLGKISMRKLGNYGWCAFEGNECFDRISAMAVVICNKTHWFVFILALINDTIFPIHAYPHCVGRSVTGTFTEDALSLNYKVTTSLLTMKEGIHVHTHTHAHTPALYTYPAIACDIKLLTL